MEEPKSEDRIQYECFNWYYNSFPDKRGLLFSIPNGGTRNIKEAMKLKATGTTPGVTDLMLLQNSRAYGIELKNEKGVLSDAQKKIHAKWNAEGVPVYICRSLEQFKAIIEEIHKSG